MGESQGALLSVVIMDAAVAGLGVMLPGKDGDDTQATFAQAVVPIDELTIDKTWDTAGLRGTGSHTLIAEDLFVPAERASQCRRVQLQLRTRQHRIRSWPHPGGSARRARRDGTAVRLRWQPLRQRVRHHRPVARRAAPPHRGDPTRRGRRRPDAHVVRRDRQRRKRDAARNRTGAHRVRFRREGCARGVGAHGRPARHERHGHRTPHTAILAGRVGRCPTCAPQPVHD